MTDVVSAIGGLSGIQVVVVGVCLLAALHLLPDFVSRLGVTKLGPIEIERRNLSADYQVRREIDAIDRDARERLWDMTEDMIHEGIGLDGVGCEAVSGCILYSISSPLRNMIMLNHMAQRLAVENERSLQDRLARGIRRSCREMSRVAVGAGCPVSQSILQIDSRVFEQFILDWIVRARSITVRACRDKVAIYSRAASEIRDRYWIDVFKLCENKNIGYVRGMGYEL